MYRDLKIDTEEYKVYFDYKFRTFEITILLGETSVITSWIGKYKEPVQGEFELPFFIHDRMVDNFSDGIVDFELIKIFLNGIKPRLESHCEQ